MSDQNWLLCNSLTRYMSDPMSLSAAIEVVHSIEPDDIENWNAWRTDWSDWRPVKDVAEFTLKATPAAKPLVPPPLPAAPTPLAVKPLDRRETFKSTEADEEIDDNTPTTPSFEIPERSGALDERRQASRRRSPRIPLRLRVIIRNEELTFRTFSVNISMTGIALEHPVPNGLYGNQCHVFIASPTGNENLKFFVRMTERNDLRFFSFADLEPATQAKLEVWLQQKTPSAS